MNTLYKPLFFIIGSIAFASCAGHFEPEDLIKAGSRKHMKVNSEVVTLLPGGYYNYSTIKLDANRDGTDDYIFSMGYWGSPGMGMKLHSSFSSAHDGALIFGAETTDTVFVRTVRTYSTNDGHILAYTLTQRDCLRRTLEHLPAETSSVFNPLWLSEGDAIGGPEDSFRKTAFSFVYDSSLPLNSTMINDTLWVNRSESRFDCHAVPDGPAVYVGIAMIEGGKFKKGWIRFRLEGPTKITFEEMAFQR